ncbi:MAG: diguanylate cyclase, partial [Vicinamibacteria bacterium]
DRLRPARFAIVLFDLDHFKAYNDEHGHLAGDAALGRLGDVLRRATRADDLAFRYGGEEFLLLLPDVDLPGALAVAERVRVAGLLHDIGKLAVPNSILDKPGTLSDEEWTAVRLHPQRTLEILARVPAFAELADDAANHHERLDGRGYFRGIDGARLSPTARILAVADVADALGSARPYRAALPVDEVIRCLDEGEGRAFCGTCVDAARAVLGRESPVGLAATAPGG